MKDRSSEPGVPNRDLRASLQQLARQTPVPEPDPRRKAALLAAFDAARREAPATRTGYWWLAALTTAAALLIAVGLVPSGAGRRGSPPESVQRPHAPPTDTRGVRPRIAAVGEFVPWPGTASLPPLESGELVRVDLPVSMLPTLGLTPVASHGAAVRADVVVGQDGLARAVRLVD